MFVDLSCRSVGLRELEPAVIDTTRFTPHGFEDRCRLELVDDVAAVEAGRVAFFVEHHAAAAPHTTRRPRGNVDLAHMRRAKPWVMLPIMENDLSAGAI